MQLLLLKFIFSALLCFLLGIIIARRYTGPVTTTGAGDELALAQWRILRAFCLYATILGLGGMFVPQFWWPWFHLLIYPPIALIAWALLACLLRKILHNSVNSV